MIVYRGNFRTFWRLNIRGAPCPTSETACALRSHSPSLVNFCKAEPALEACTLPKAPKPICRELFQKALSAVWSLFGWQVRAKEDFPGAKLVGRNQSNLKSPPQRHPDEIRFFSRFHSRIWRADGLTFQKCNLCRGLPTKIEWCLLLRVVFYRMRSPKMPVVVQIYSSWQALFFVFRFKIPSDLDSSKTRTKEFASLQHAASSKESSSRETLRICFRAYWRSGPSHTGLALFP